MRLKLIIIFIFLLIIIIFFLRPYYQFINKTLKISLLKTLFSKDSLKTFDNQVNILILGIPGSNHQGPNLSDTIIAANYNFDNNQLTIISIPRDIWSDTLQDKINTAYAYGEAKQTGGGLKLAKAEISTIIGLPIRYGIVIDFSKFEELIDFLGGIEVEVEHSFTDKRFPIAGKENDDCGGNDKEFNCRYETISFKKGLTIMDGKTALKFVRSRNAIGAEGSDFAREARQQKVIDAIEKKLIKILKTADIKKINSVYQIFNRLLIRDITNQQLAIIGKNILFKKLFGKSFVQKSLSLTEDLFVVPPYYQYDGKYVLIPQNNNFTLIHQLISCQIRNQTGCDRLKKERKEN